MQNRIHQQSMTSSVHSSRILEREREGGGGGGGQKQCTSILRTFNILLINSSFDYNNTLCKNHKS